MESHSNTKHRLDSTLNDNAFLNDTFDTFDMSSVLINYYAVQTSGNVWFDFNWSFLDTFHLYHLGCLDISKFCKNVKKTFSEKPKKKSQPVILEFKCRFELF